MTKNYTQFSLVFILLLQTVLPVPRTCQSYQQNCLMDLQHLEHSIFSPFAKINYYLVPSSGPGSIVGIATAYRLDDLGIESWWGRDFPHLSRPALRPTQPPVQWVPGLSSLRCGQGVTLTPHPLLVPMS